ncbi:MAG: ammonium transporter [Omnitrophica WOR_2 bacterium GWF2_38_59]|nr:MAG: ammonium transporter [Omnitrophica WOR_2 bacterium GWF2_38_59]OGX50254.1 MAG: ammonium transporter [Omnitrophica WOR_2 bacterium RIFOXYA2_FULL_38_17]OGX54056.1 MAG: ammonium transporter [Omnitrophica WOR_2 bacterium RIFOXYA12_FULL_38_10]OGX56737.1 MAG: ammonium transporter [Omnitrophica WOR_2 bacterium RIFOXYB2_FULL_38_16]OGX57262.1 MAG: ammonium transporter [Omnitrophica WOR_2 bacterium RIFOXYC2_FULL_38_12]
MLNKIMKNIVRSLPLIGLIIMFSVMPAFAEETETNAKAIEALTTNLNIVWTSVAAFLVFFMQAGFAMVEVGFTRAKNAVNIIMKNLMDFAVGTLVFFFIGFGLMFGKSNGIFGTTNFMLGGDVLGSAEHWNWAFLIFQTVFAGTSATIVSGAMAERTKFKAYLCYSVFICAFIYPIFGSWAWGGLLDGGGWLENLKTPFVDFAGSTVVHSIGGWLALAGAIVLGPRLGKYSPDGKSKAIPGHNITLAALGVFILWFGWFGFNPGSTTVGNGEIGRVAVTTNLAAAAGAVSAMIIAWILFKKPDASMTLNGALAGLVAITAGCYTVTPMGSIWIGAIGGILVVFSVIFIDQVLKVDDPVGAVSVHGVCGAWGTLACGLFNAEKVLGTGEVSGGLLYGGGMNQLITQLIGVGAAFIWAFSIGLILFNVIKVTMGIRVSPEEELRGLDIMEHGMEAYDGFQIFSNS